MKKTILKIILNLFGVTATLAGLLVSLWAHGYSKDAKASLSWPSVQGVVVESFEDVHTSTTSSGSRPPMKSYIPVVRYSYQVDELDYTNDQISFASQNNAKRENAKATLSKYPVATELDVHYNPENPRKSILEPGTHRSTHIWFFLGLGMLITGLIELFLANIVLDNVQIY